MFTPACMYGVDGPAPSNRGSTGMIVWWALLWRSAGAAIATRSGVGGG